MATLRAIIELEELNKDTDMTKKVILSAKKVLAFYEAGEERVTQLLTALRDKFSSMIDSVQHYRSAVTRRDKLWFLQFLWCMISPATMEEERARQQLLQDIVHLWITTRGHSKARRVKEDYKREKGKSVKGKHSLRKELAVSVESKD